MSKTKLTKEYLEDRFVDKKWSYFMIYKESGWSKATINKKLGEFKLRRKRTLRNINLSGERFGKILVIDKSEIRGRCINWECECDCGKKCLISTGNLLSGNSQSCGCSNHKQGSDSPFWKGYKKISGRTFCVAQSNAEKRGIYFNITINELADLFDKQNGKCALTGWDLILEKDSRNTASIDRIDSSKGYTVDNVQWVHKQVNIAKNTLSQERFLEICKSVVENKQLIQNE
jgi:hypothetical protein